MKQFMLLIRTQGDHFTEISEDAQKDHLEKVKAYIEDLMTKGQVKSAQPLEMESVIISGTKGKLKDGPFNESKEVIAGYYLLVANDLQEAVEIAKRNPIFESAKDCRIEVRPIRLLHGIND